MPHGEARNYVLTTVFGIADLILLILVASAHAEDGGLRAIFCGEKKTLYLKWPFPVSLRIQIMRFMARRPAMSWLTKAAMPASQSGSKGALCCVFLRSNPWPAAS